MPPVPSRWHDGHVPLRPYNTPDRKVALGFALYGVRLQTEGVAPGAIEATIEIRDAAGTLLGRLDLDAEDCERLMRLVSQTLDLDYGPWDRDKLARLVAELRGDRP